MDVPTAAPTPHAPPPDRVVTAYRGVTLFDGTGRPPRPGTTIVTEGSLIRAVGDDSEIGVDIPDDAQVIDLEGRFVVPGLIDAHQHLATPPNRSRAEAVLRRLVYSGVTAIRDMADDLRHVGDLSRATLVGEIPGPDIRYAALMAGAGFFEDPRARAVCQGDTPGAVPWMQGITAQTDLRLAVAMARGTNASGIKLYADLDKDTVAAITAEAHRQGIAVWAHATVFPATPSDVVDGGVDVISHTVLLGHEGDGEKLTTFTKQPPIDYARFMTGDDPEIADLFVRMKEKGTILDATVAVSGHDHLAAPGPGLEERTQANADIAAVLTRQAHQAGVEITAGTDFETDLDDPFPALYQELDFLVRHCGLSTAEALRSATLVGARSAGAEATMGSVEQGKLANFAVFADDPVRSINNLRSITETVRRGHRYKRSEFDRDFAGAAR